MATKTAMVKYKRLLKNDPDSSFMIPFKTLNVDECLELVNISGNALEFIPSGKRTKKLCIAAVENMPEALEFVPNRFKTVEMCKNAYKKSIKVLTLTAVFMFKSHSGNMFHFLLFRKKK